MTNKELIAILQNFPDDMEIRINAPSHDYIRSQNALDIKGASIVDILTEPNGNPYGDPDKVVAKDDYEFDSRIRSKVLLIK